MEFGGYDERSVLQSAYFYNGSRGNSHVLRRRNPHGYSSVENDGGRAGTVNVGLGAIARCVCYTHVTGSHHRGSMV